MAETLEVNQNTTYNQGMLSHANIGGTVCTDVLFS